MTDMHNAVCHVEYDVTDLERARDYYAGLFGWRFSSFGPSMLAFGVGDEHMGGLTLVEKVQPGSSPSLWFRVKDMDATLDKAVALGGTVERGRSELPGVGWSAVVNDLDGNKVGLVMFTEDAV